MKLSYRKDSSCAGNQLWPVTLAGSLTLFQTNECQIQETDLCRESLIKDTESLGA